ncbi:MAG: DNA primase [Ruminococcaceae bacterium]|nr:DNA primase [Oscillospiraceae bacterium]
MRISDEQVAEITEKNDIADVISDYVKLDRKSGGFLGLCPFHKEKTPSFHVNDSKQLFKCFGCGKGGNVVHFIRLAEGLGYVDALLFLADRAGVTVQYSNDDPARGKRDELCKNILSLNKHTARFFYDSLKKSDKALAYLKNRGLSVETVKKFGLGYAQEGWSSLTDYFIASGTSKELLKEAGLSSKSSKSDRYYDRFRDRLMFPIFDVMGNVIAFGGRRISDDDSQPKYINSAETAVYTKGKHLYGLNLARKSGSRRVIIVEGYMDCIALHQKGIDWAVASLGTALTSNQARLLKKYFDEVIIAYDADVAGKDATIRGMEILSNVGFRVKVFRLKGAKDADEYLRKHSSEDFIKQLDSSLTLIEYKISLAADEWSLDKNDTRAEFLKQATMILASISSVVECEMYITWVSEKYGVPREPLKDQVEIVKKGGKYNADKTVLRRIQTSRFDTLPEKDPEKNSPEYKKTDKNEKYLLVLLSEDNACLKKYGETALTLLTIEENKLLLKVLLKKLSEGKRTGSDVLLSDAELDDAQILSEIIGKFIMPQNTMLACREIMDKLTKKNTTDKKNEILAKLKEKNLSPAERDVLLKQLNKLLINNK